MNHRMIFRVLGSLLILEPLMMLPSALISFFNKDDDLYGFLIIMLISGLIGLLLMLIKPNNKTLKVRDGMAIVTFGWLAFSLFGSMPFIISGYIPSFVDAFFESVSGFTTTGASILKDIEALPKGLLFWRSFTHWIGGMGILVFTVALLPKFGAGGFQIFKAESPGPETDKIVPRINTTAKILYIAYIVLTISQIFLLVFAGMSWYDACVHTFGTMGTGGFSNKNLSIAAYESSAIHIIISIFMVLAGVNFSLYYCFYQRKWSQIISDIELKAYLGIIMFCTIVIAFNISGGYDKVTLAVRDAFFQVAAIITTTGYATVDFNVWPTLSKVILFFLMFIGGSAGSTGGAIKVIRVVTVSKLISREVSRIFHPRAVIPIKIGKKMMPSNVVNSIASFVTLYILIYIIGVLLISLEGLDFETTITSVAATLGNIGPGLALVGPRGNYSEFSDFSKIVFSVLMLLGRLELFTVLALLTPRLWVKDIDKQLVRFKKRLKA
jgi:trk system potassium uptake protein